MPIVYSETDGVTIWYSQSIVAVVGTCNLKIGSVYGSILSVDTVTVDHSHGWLTLLIHAQVTLNLCDHVDVVVDACEYAPIDV